MADEENKDSTSGNVAKDKVTAPVPSTPSEDDTTDKPHTGRQKKYDGGPVPKVHRGK